MKHSIGVPSPAMVVALLALFVALGGSAYAVNKVGTKQIKNKAVTTAKIKNKAVTTAKVSNGAITGAKLGGASVTGSKIAEEAVGRDQIATGAVDGAGLADLSVGANKLRGGSVTSGKLSTEAVTQEKIAEEAVGLAQIAPGAIGSMVEYTAISLVPGYDSEIAVPAGEYFSGAVSCPDGKTMIFASWRPTSPIVTPPVAMTDMDQYEPPHTFRLEFLNSSGTEQRLGLWGLCI